MSIKLEYKHLTATADLDLTHWAHRPLTTVDPRDLFKIYSVYVNTCIYIFRGKICHPTICHD